MAQYRIIKEKSYPGYRTGKGEGEYKVQKKFLFFWKTEQELRENEMNTLFDFQDKLYDLAFKNIKDAETYINNKLDNNGKVIKYIKTHE